MNWKEIEDANNKLRGISRDKGSYIYQYRSLESFWKIIKGDGFFATNARFSNDSEEQQLGIDMIKRSYGIIMDNKAWKGDCYIVCFCEEDDKLSQWRGYAKTGVSMGFDFSNIRPFYITKTKEERVSVYNGCGHVAYFDENTDTEEIIQWLELSKDEYDERKRFWEELLYRRIPYIKHKGFQEENEYRLVFEDIDLKDCVQYRENKNIMLPYIEVNMGEVNDKKEDDIVVRLMFDTNNREGKNWKRKIENVIKDYSNCIIIECQNSSMDSALKKYCKGCLKTRLANLDFYSNNNWHICPCNTDYCFKKEKAIYISDCKMQKDIFNALYNTFHDNKSTSYPKIWCEGHLPIRSITVGPNKDIDYILEDIEHYCKYNNSYWLRDVEVKKSKIPYRSEPN